MKIALYVSSWPPGHNANGIVTYIAHMVPALRKLGHGVFILTPNAVQDGDPWVVDIRRYIKSPSLLRRALFKLRPVGDDCQATRPIVSAIQDLVKQHQIDIFEMEESFGWSNAISRHKIVPVVVRLHGPWFLSGRFSSNAPYSPNEYAREKDEGRGIRSADYVTAPSDSVLDAVKSHYGIELPRSISIPNPLDAVDDAKRWNAKTCDKNSLLYVGRFDELKGGDLVIRTFGELAGTYPNLKLTFVGPDNGVRGVSGEIVLFDRYANEVLSRDAMARVTFLGKLPRHEIDLLRTKHFLTVCASQSESFGYTALEALSFGCPVVATAVGGVPSIIENGHNGYLVPPQNVQAMVFACKTLFEDCELAARLGKAGWQDCRRKFGSDDIAKRTVQVYHNAIESFRSRRSLKSPPYR